ncbi:unnamed protein product [Symbiodinium necroappetens]|uniref:Uncharacterized protein n=1 Tax=Symbiodinium necroappetens TaxID=1628268 RepID=A0A812NPZ3_9DINO|nr:unnamed protein product [Symbiodinium necroappetens]
MDPTLRRRRQEPDARDVAQEEALADGPVARPFWSDRARAEADLMRARPSDLDPMGDRLPEVRVDQVEVHPAYGGESNVGGGKGKGSPPGTLESDVLRAASGRADGHSRGRNSTVEQPRDLPGIQEVESAEDNHPAATPEPLDLLSMSPVEQAPSENQKSSPKHPGTLEPKLTGQLRELSSAKIGTLAEVQNPSGSGALDSEVGGSSRAFQRPTLETSEDVGAQEVSSTTVESVSDGKVLNMSHSFSGEASGSVGGLAYEISDPSEQQFEIARLRVACLGFVRSPSVLTWPDGILQCTTNLFISTDGFRATLFMLERFRGWTLDFNLRRVLALSTSLCLPAANQAYVRWLATSPLERLSTQQEFDQVNLVQPQHALLEQRCVTLILQSIPDELRVDIVASRHLSVAGMIFRLMTVFQPGGSSERVAATLTEAAKLLRQWAQWHMRLTQLQAAELDTTLLVKGLDTLTQKALARHPSSLFRLATFHERLGIDYAEVSLSSLKEWLGKHLRSDSCGELELQAVAKVLFPDLPETLESQVAACPSFDPSCVPFNRRTRRRLFDPQVPTTVHLFAGQQRWRNSVGQILEIDIAKGAELLSYDVCGMLLRAATLGVIDGVVIEKVFTCSEMPEGSTAWEWPEYENVSVCLGGWTATFDQGTLGNPCSKASALYTSSFQLYAITREREGPLLNLCQEALMAKMSPEVWERTAPEDHAANGAAEVAIRELKRSLGAGASRVLEELPDLSCHTAHLLRRGSGILVGPAPQTLSSYFVLFEDDTMCITSAVYPVDYQSRPSSYNPEPPLRPTPLSGQSAGVFQAPQYRRPSKSPAVRVSLHGPSLPAAGGMSALADVSDFSNVQGRAEESTESDAESLDFLSDPQQEIPAFQEARMSLSTDFLQGALEELSASEEGENPGSLGEIQHKEEEFERQLAGFVPILDPGDAVDDDTEIPLAFFRATLQNHQWDLQPVIMVTDLHGQPEPLVEVLQHHDDDSSMYADEGQFLDRLLVFMMWNFRQGRTQVLLFRITEAREEQPAERVLQMPGPEPPAVMKFRVKAFRLFLWFLDGRSFGFYGNLELRKCLYGFKKALRLSLRKDA